MASIINTARLAELITACRDAEPQKSRQAMNDLLAFLQPHVFSIALRMVIQKMWADASPRHTADDLANEALLRFYTNFHKMNDFWTIEAWFATVLKRMIIDRLRKNLSKPVESLTDVIPETPATDNTERTVILRAELIAAMRKLTKEHQEILILLYVEGLTVLEAARALNVQHGTAKTRHFYALRNLRNVVYKRHTSTELYELAAR